VLPQLRDARAEVLRRLGLGHGALCWFAPCIARQVIMVIMMKINFK
jgi:hypothetical protein